MKKTLSTILSLVLILCASAALAEAPAYIIQTNDYWAEDGGWMVMMEDPDGYNWMDNESVATQYNAVITIDDDLDCVLKMTTKENWISGAMYCFFDTKNLGVETEKLEMRLKLYVSDAAALQGSLGEIEIISGMTSWIGNRALRWTIDWTRMQDGWNDLTLRYSDAQQLGEDVYNARKTKFLWLAVQNAPADVEIMVSPIEFYSVEAAAE